MPPKPLEVGDRVIVRHLPWARDFRWSRKVPGVVTSPPMDGHVGVLFDGELNSRIFRVAEVTRVLPESPNMKSG